MSGISEVTHPSESNTISVSNKGLSHIARGGGVSLIGLAAGKIFAFVTEMILARFLGVTNYGLLALARSIIQIPSFSTDLGMRQGVVRYGAIYRNKTASEYQKGLLFGSLQITIIVSLVSVIILFSGAHKIADLFNKPGLEVPIRILSLGLIPMGITVVIASYARSQLHFGIDVLLRISAQQISVFILSIVVVGYLKRDVIGAALIFFMASVLNALIGLGILSRKYFQPFKTIKANFEIKKWLRFSIPTFVLDISYLLLRHISRLLLGYFGQTQFVGLFTVAASVTDNLIFFLIAFNPILAPLIVSAHERGDHKEFIRNYRMIGRWQLTLTLPAALIMLVFPKEMMLLFGADFLASANVLILLVLAQIITIAAGPSGMVLQMTGHQDIELVNGIVAVMLNLGLGVWLIPQYGVLGAGLSTAFAILLLQAARISEIYLILKIVPYDRSYIKCVVAASVSTICVWFVRKIVLTAPTLASLIQGTVLIIVIYVLLLVFLKIEDSDKEALKKMWSLFERKSLTSAR